MNIENLGNKLNVIINVTKAALFEQGELAQLTYGAFDIAARGIQNSDQVEIEISYPVGYRPDKTSIQSTRKYCKEDLLGKYQFLAFHQLSANGLLQLVTIVEALLGDIIRAVVTKYPQKLGAKRTISLQIVLESTSIEEIHLRATDTLLNELSYKSPIEFADSIQSLMPINLLECPSFHKYVEIKATRDIIIHNRGMANDIYVRKSSSHARTAAGNILPVDVQYFLESYEACLQMSEWLEVKLHDHWHSSDFETRQNEKTFNEPSHSIAEGYDNKIVDFQCPDLSGLAGYSGQ